MDYYLVFYSTHHLLRAEKQCLAEGIPVTLVPIPREITSDCGMAVKFPARYLEKMVALVSAAGLSHAGIFALEAGKARRIA